LLLKTVPLLLRKKEGEGSFIFPALFAAAGEERARLSGLAMTG